jgi:hypothetical protein
MLSSRFGNFASRGQIANPDEPSGKAVVLDRLLLVGLN